jgi:hypothetical protein
MSFKSKAQVILARVADKYRLDAEAGLSRADVASSMRSDRFYFDDGEASLSGLDAKLFGDVVSAPRDTVPN